MKDKYKEWISYIANDIELPYLKSLEAYGLKKDEMDLVLSKLFNEPVIYIKPMHGVYNKNKKRIYHEDSSGYWEKREYEYDNNSNKIYYVIFQFKFRQRLSG